jgi:hypothetical protein
MARFWEREVVSLALLFVCAAAREGTSLPAGGVGFTYIATCVPSCAFCAPYTRRNGDVVRTCGPRDSDVARGGSGTNVPGRGRFIPKYTGRFSGWRGLRYGK